MAKPIYITENDIEDICAELRSTLNNTKCYGSIDIKRSLKSDDRVAALYFTPTAWIKMTALVSRFETEVQWHGMVRRAAENVFEIYDIVVPPHEVSGATVTSEYKPYMEWMDGLDDDTFNSVRFHGHSHVNMGVTPSAVDNKYRLDLITQLPKPTGDDDVFYIFLIINKKHEWSAEIYDLTNNALYDTNDVYIACFLNDGDLDDFITQAKKLAVSRVTKYGAYNGTHSSRSTYNGHAHSGSVKQGSESKAPKNNAKQSKENTTGRYFGYDTLDEYYDAVYGEGWNTTALTEQSDDNDDDPNGPFYAKGY